MLDHKGPPPVISGFTYLERLGAGGYSTVYLFEQHMPRREVAVKVMNADVEDKTASRFESEANLMARVSSHPATDSGEEQSSSIDSFRYVVRMVVTPVPAYGFAVHEADDLTVRLEVRPHSGGQGYDVVDWNSDQVAHDVLDHYERWLEYVGTSEKTESRFARRL